MEIGARRRRAGSRDARSSQDRLIRGDRKGRSELAAGEVAAIGLDRHIRQRSVHGVEEWLDRYGRLVLEKNDQFLANMDESNFFVRN